MEAQRTLRRPISCVGIGLHSGNKVNLSLKPAAPDHGIRFRRTDMGNFEVPAIQFIFERIPCKFGQRLGMARQALQFAVAHGSVVGRQTSSLSGIVEMRIVWIGHLVRILRVSVIGQPGGRVRDASCLLYFSSAEATGYYRGLEPVS